MNIVAFQNLLGHVHPILATLAGIPLAVVLLVVALTAPFVGRALRAHQALANQYTGHCNLTVGRCGPRDQAL